MTAGECKSPAFFYIYFFCLHVILCIFALTFSVKFK